MSPSPGLTPPSGRLLYRTPGDAKAEDDERKRDRINYARVAYLYRMNPSDLTWPEYETLLEGVKWNRNLDKGEHPEGSWMERNCVPGTVQVVGSGLGN